MSLVNEAFIERKNHVNPTIQNAKDLLDHASFGPLMIKAATIAESWIATMQPKRDDWQAVAEAYRTLTLASFLALDLTIRNEDACKLARGLAMVSTFSYRWLNSTFYEHFDLPISMEVYVSTAAVIAIMFSHNVDAAKAFMGEHDKSNTKWKLHQPWMDAVFNQCAFEITFPILFPTESSAYQLLLSPEHTHRLVSLKVLPTSFVVR